MPLTIALCVMLATIGERLRPSPRLTSLLVLACAGVSVAASVRGTILTHRAPRQAARAETAGAFADMRAAIETAPPGTDVYIPNRPFKSIGPMMLANQKAFPGWAALFTILFPANVVDGRRVFFIEPDPLVVAAVANGNRTAGLLVSAPSNP